MTDTTTTTDDKTTTTAATTAATTASTGTTTSTAATTGTTATTQTGKWPDAWRQELAAGDEKEQKRLERFTSPMDIYKSFREFEKLQSSGELRRNVQFPDKGTPEDQAAWRKSQGLPESPDKYELKLKDGLVIGKDDKPVVDGFLKHAHGANLNSAQASAAVEWYYEEVERQSQARADADKSAAAKAREELRTEWGGDTQANMNMIDSLLAGAPQEFRDKFKFGRLADGTPIFASTDGLKFLAYLARQINPAASVVPAGTANVASAIDDEITQIEGWMKAPRGSPENAKYWGSEKTQSRYRDLLTARDQVHKKAA